MNEQALQDAYTLFSQKGYNGSFDEFVELIYSNPDALGDSYTLFTEGGYAGSFEDFSSLMGVKKKTKPKSIWFRNWKLALLSPAHYQETSDLT